MAARKKPAAYPTLEVAPEIAIKPAPGIAIKPGRAGRTLKEAAKPVMLYLNPAAVKALKRYALAEDTKVHTLLLDAVQAWFKSHGLRERVRALDPPEPRRMR